MFTQTSSNKTAPDSKGYKELFSGPLNNGVQEQAVIECALIHPRLTNLLQNESINNQTGSKTEYETIN